MAFFQQGVGNISQEILVHIDTTASHSCCRFVTQTSMMWISFFIASKNVLYWSETHLHNNFLLSLSVSRGMYNTAAGHF